MRRSRVMVALGFGLALLVAREASANPVGVSGLGAWWFLVLLVFPLEGLLITMMAKEAAALPRFVAGWTLVTLTTFGLLVWVIGALAQVIAWPLVAVAVGETLVIVAEAWCIRWMLSHPFFAANSEKAPNLRRCLVYSLAANLTSLLVGLTLAWLAGYVGRVAW